LTETHLGTGVVFRTDRLTERGGTAILLRRGTDHHAVPVQGLQHLEATAIWYTLVGKPVKILAVYLSPSRPLIGSDLSACLGDCLPVVMAGDLNAKHVEWNSRVVTKRGRVLRDYAVKNSCLIHGPNTPTTISYNPSATPDIIDIIITKDLVTPMYLNVCVCRLILVSFLYVVIDYVCGYFVRVFPDST
jgi:hypothetical protein